MRQILVFSALAIAAMFIFTSNVNAETEYENPDLQLKFNWKEEGDGLSPQTKLTQMILKLKKQSWLNIPTTLVFSKLIDNL